MGGNNIISVLCSFFPMCVYMLCPVSCNHDLTQCSQHCSRCSTYVTYCVHVSMSKEYKYTMKRCIWYRWICAPVDAMARQAGMVHCDLVSQGNCWDFCPTFDSGNPYWGSKQVSMVIKFGIVESTIYRICRWFLLFPFEFQFHRKCPSACHWLPQCREFISLLHMLTMPTTTFPVGLV